MPSSEPDSHPGSPVSTRADEAPRAHLLDTIASKVACVYATLLHGTGSSLRPGAAETFAQVFLRQTSGYFQTLPRILAQHAQHAQHEPAQLSVKSGPPLSASTATLLTDLAMHDGPPDSPASTPASDAADTADTQSASSSGMRSCSCRCGGPAAPRDTTAALALRPRLSDLGFGCGSSDTSLSERSCGPGGAGAPLPHALPPHWQSFCGGRVRLLDTSAAAAAGDVESEAPGGPQAATWSVDFATQCEHHILPFYGTVHAVVAAGGRPLTAACLCDIVDMFSLRLQVQERLTHQVRCAAACCDAGHDCSCRNRSTRIVHQARLRRALGGLRLPRPDATPRGGPDV